MKSASAQPNRRDQQRVDVTADVALERPDGCQCSCTTANLLAQGNRAPENPMSVKARFLVPVQPVQQAIIAAGSRVHFRRIAQDRFHVSVQLEEFEGVGCACVDRCLRSLLNERSKSV
jgi:hypothetical protein